MLLFLDSVNPIGITRYLSCKKIVCFGGMALQMGGILPFEFLNYLSLHYTNCDLLFFVDKYQCWYHKGFEEYITDLGLDLVSPSLTEESPSGYFVPSPIHTNSDEYDVILLELCELFLYVFKSSAYSTYYQYVCHDNPWMWGMESMIYKKMGLTIGILNKITMIRPP